MLLFIVLLASRVFSQSCLPDGIDFTNQVQIDNFQSDYPGCTQIEGNVEISGADITNLDGLNVVNNIGGYLYITNNAILENINGLSLLNYVGGSLLISTNSNLDNLAGLQGLVGVLGDVFISNNETLKDISALANINASNVLNLRITGNPELVTCNNPFICNYLANPVGKITIYNNAPGCNSLPEIAGLCGITLPCLPYGDYYFFSQAEIDAFPVNYPGCTDLNGMFHIEGDDITNLDALGNIHSLNGTLEIHDNSLLASLAGLNSLAVVDGAISIVRNDYLTDISSLQNLDTSLISFLVISTNPSLSECDIQSFCAYLAGPFGYSHNNINSNNTGCMSKDEVLLECGNVGIDDEGNEAQLLVIAPNPAFDRMKIINLPPQSSQFQISIFDITGRKLLLKNVYNAEIEIDVSDFTEGIYFVRLWDGNEIKTGKFAKTIH